MACGLAACDAAKKVPSNPAKFEAPVVALSPNAPLAPAGRVTDAAHLLKPNEVQALTKYLIDFETRTQHQMVVVTVPSLSGQPIEHYTLGLANRWDIGRKGHNDGVVVLLAPNEKRMRIEIGKGLEKALTNDYCARVIELMKPAFQDGRFYDGLMTGVTELARAAK